MTDLTPPPIKIDGYHAHVYFNTETRQRAQRLRDTSASTLGVEVRELSDEPRGPTPFRNSALPSPPRSSRRSCHV